MTQLVIKINDISYKDISSLKDPLALPKILCHTSRIRGWRNILRRKIMEDFEIELKKTFLEEATQLIEDVEQCFLDLENNPSDPAMISKIFRLAHNLKGSANGVGITAVGEFTHHLESLLLMIKNGEIIPDQLMVGLLLRSTDHIGKMIARLKIDLNSEFDSRELIAEIEATMANKGVAAAAVANKKIEKPKAPDEIPGLHLFDDADTFSPEPAAADPAPKPVANVVPIQKIEPKPVASKGVAPGQKGAQTQQADEGIRVSLVRVEKLIDFVGEIVILHSVLRDQVSDGKNPALRRVVDQIGKVTKEVQDLSMSLRMVPAKPVFQKLQRIVRDTSNALNKDIKLNMIGADTELDKTVLERISDPLVHLIRNSCDHGVEATADRVARGKSAQGTVKLAAYRQSGKLIFEVGDDGGGLNPEKLIKIAVSKGVIPEGTQMSDKDAMNLIFAPGFSTKDQVTDISGRGVGMDVVRTNIELMQGQITIDSEIGKGTTFKIMLPLTLAIIDGMVIRLKEDRFVLPLSQVHETVRLASAEVKSTVGLGDILLLRGENIPVYDLGVMMGRRSESYRGTEAIAIIIRTMEKPYAVVVDDIIGRFQVVTKQLGVEVQSLKGVSGSTILGDGKPALIIEMDDLVKMQNKHAQGASPGSSTLKVAS
jgi:two-component system chemotaxis sensor kinase CheA